MFKNTSKYNINMKNIDILQEFKQNGKSVFTTRDLDKFIENKKYTSVILNRLLKKQEICKIKKGIYYIKNADVFSIASMITFPSYISYLSSLYLSGIIEQIPTKIQVVSSKYLKPLDISETRVEFTKFSKKLLFGYYKKKINGYVVFIAKPEKAVLDNLHQTKMPFHYTKQILDELDKELLINYAKKFDSSVIKRIGYLLDLNGYDYHKELKKYLSYRYTYLSLTNKKKGEKNKKWKIINNEGYYG